MRPAVLRVRRGVVIGRSGAAIGLATIAVVAANGELVATALSRGSADPIWLPLAAAIAILSLAALLRPIEPAPGEKFSLAAAAAFFGAMILPPFPAVAAVASAALVAKLAQRRSVRSTLVNVAQASGATAAAVLVLGLRAEDGASVIAVAAACYLGVTLGSVALMILASQGGRQAVSFLEREWLPTVALLGIGGVAALAWSRDPLAVVLLLPVLAAVERAVRRTGARSVSAARERPDDHAYDAAHELRNPLAALASDLAYIETPLPPAERDALASARVSARRLADLVDRLLVLGRMEPDAARDGSASVLLAARRAVASFPLHERVDLSVEVEPTLLAAMPPDLLEVAVRDVVGNALAYTVDGTVRVTARREGDRVAVVVADTGIGIAPDEMPRIFERFYRGPRARALAPGTGLGLAIVQRIVEEHGGAIDVRSGTAKGTVVKLLLPRAAGPAGKA